MMLALFKINLKQALRSRLLITLLIFTFLVQYGGLNVLSQTSLYGQGALIRFDVKDMLFASLVLQLFNGMFLAALYGIWFMPQAHQGQRNFLTFVIPVPKWMFPGAYALTLLALLGCQYLVTFLTFGMEAGWLNLWNSPWDAVILCLILETLAFLVVTFGFSVFSMVLGQIPTFILGVLFIIVQQIAGVFFRLPLDEYLQKTYPKMEWIRSIYYKLPPLGELVYKLRENFLKPQWEDPQIWLWASWLALFFILFQLRIVFPAQTKSVDIA